MLTKVMLKKVLIAIALLCGNASLALPQEAQSATPPQSVQEKAPVRLEIKLNKTTYVLGEPIVVAIMIANTSEVAMSDRWFSLPLQLRYCISDAKGEEVQLFYPNGEAGISLGYGSIPSHSFATTDLDIVVGDVIEASDRVERAESIRFQTDPLVVGGYALAPGTYTLKVTQNFSRHRGKEFIPESISDSATFAVRKPFAEEAAALELFKVRPYQFTYFPESDVAKEARWIGKGRSKIPRALKSWQDTKATYTKIIRDYEKTPYAPYALYYIGRISQVQGQWQDAIAAYEQLLRERPLFPLKADLLYYLAISYLEAGQRDKARATFNALKTFAPSQYIAPSVEYPVAFNGQGVSRIEALEKRLNTPAE